MNKSEQIKEISINKWVGNESINGTNKNFVHWWCIKEIKFLNNRIELLIKRLIKDDLKILAWIIERMWLFFTYVKLEGKKI